MKKLLTGIVMAVCAQVASAAVVYNSWTSNEGQSGNYILTITENAGALDFHLTVDPWNAEALGLFVNLGDVDVGGLTLSNVTPAGRVLVTAKDVQIANGNLCGNGCNLNGLKIPAQAGDDGEWEMVFGLGNTGYDGIQTFSFTVESDQIDLTEDMLGIVGIRAQQLCDGSQTLPGGACGGSDKSWGLPVVPTTFQSTVSEPAMIGLLGLGLAGIAAARRRRVA
ncbi:MAG: PEP-CTERM sorting domain-containing protein [Burkholderiaceae bacterium]